jgi:hypothetical protein
MAAAAGSPRLKEMSGFLCTAYYMLNKDPDIE